MNNHLLKRAGLAGLLALAISAVPGQAQTVICGALTETPLMAGQHIESGWVIVGNDQFNLYVTYATDDPWRLREVHVAIAASVEELPTNRKGSPAPGRFPYKATFSPGLSVYTVTIPLGGAIFDSPIFIAAHAVVESSGGSGGGGSETGWGQGPEFPGASNWSMYFSHVVQTCGGSGE